jgi:ferric-dicitrate binding protein FerR (iron transport regulator)
MNIRQATITRWSRNGLSALLSVVLLLCGATSATASDMGDRAIGYAKALHERAVLDVKRANTRLATAESDLRFAREALSVARGAKDGEAVRVASEAVQVAEDERRQAERLLQLARKRVADRERTLQEVRKASARKDKDSLLVPVDGSVRRVGAGGAEIADPSVPVGAGQSIVTGGDGSARLFLAGGDVDIQVYPSSSLSVERDDPEGLMLSMEKGLARLKARIGKWSRRFEVRTPAAVTSVRGTDFSVDRRAGRETLYVYEGVVAATPCGRGEPVLVKAGEMLVMEGEGAWSPPRPFDPANREENGKDAAARN